MLTVIENQTNSQTITIPSDEMKKLGINNGDEVELSKNDNDEIILRNAAEAERKRKFEAAKDKVFEEWNDVFIALAKGVDESESDKESGGRFVLSSTIEGKYKFMLIAANGRILFESSVFESQKDAQKSIEEMKTGLSEIKDEILNFPIKIETESI